MKKINLLFTFSLLVIVFFISCNGKNKTSGNIEIPEFLKNEKLLKTHEFKITDTAEGGIPKVVQFYNNSDKENIIIEKKYYQTGDIFIEGALKNGKRDGEWVAWYENGVMWSIGHYKEGIKEGIEEAYYENGVLRYSKNFKNDLAEGIAKYYDIDGNLAAEIMFENNEVVWEKKYDE